MIYTLEVKAEELHTVRKIMKIHAKTEEEAKELCLDLIKSGNDRGYWEDCHLYGTVKNPYVSKCLGSETDFEYQMRTGTLLEDRYK